MTDTPIETPPGSQLEQLADQIFEDMGIKEEDDEAVDTSHEYDEPDEDEKVEEAPDKEGEEKPENKDGEETVKFTVGEGEAAKEISLDKNELIQMYEVFEKVGGEADKMFDALEEEVTTRRLEFYEGVESAHKQTQEVFGAYATMLQNFFPQKPNPNNYNSNEAYNADLAAFNQFSDEFQQAVKAYRHSQSEQQQVAQKKRQDWIKEEQSKLFRRLPEWEKDWDGYSKAAEEILISQYGFKKEELNNVIDHRYYRVFNDLIKYNKATKNAKEAGNKSPVNKKIDKAPPTKGANPNTAPQGTKYKRALDNLKNHPRSDTASMTAWDAWLTKNKMG